MARYKSKPKKVCPKCNEEQDYSEFYKGRRTCKKCCRIISRDWKRKNRSKGHYIQERYNISTEQALEIYESQGGRCGICRKKLDFWGRNRHIDHCHKTNKVRGILCNGCNRGLGMLGDDEKGLLKALHYLRNNYGKV